MGKLYCMMGKSSSGKDTLYGEILATEELQLEPIVPYTTRPIRDGEREGVEYHFCTNEKKQELLDEGKVIEIRTYHTVYGPWDYFTVDDGEIDLAMHNYLMIGTVAAYLKIRDYFGKSNVLPIYIEVEDGIRLQRALMREMQQDHPKYEEMCRRFLADAEDFSEQALKQAEIERVFINEDLQQTKDAIVSYIRETM